MMYMCNIQLTLLSFEDTTRGPTQAGEQSYGKPSISMALEL